MIYFVDEVGPSAAAQSVAIRDLPLRDVGQNPISFYFVYFRSYNLLCNQDFTCRYCFFLKGWLLEWDLIATQWYLWQMKVDSGMLNIWNLQCLLAFLVSIIRLFLPSFCLLGVGCFGDHF